MVIITTMAEDEKQTDIDREAMCGESQNIGQMFDKGLNSRKKLIGLDYSWK